MEGLGAVVRGDTATARRTLEALEGLPRVDQLRLGAGPHLLRALLAARQDHWDEVRDLLGPPALRGEHDGSSPAQVASLATRWLLADAYQRAGRLDSAAAYLELAVASTRVPFSHLALRGLAYSFAERRLAVIYEKLGQEQVAQQHWKEFAGAFTTPDADFASLMPVETRVR